MVLRKNYTHRKQIARRRSLLEPNNLGVEQKWGFQEKWNCPPRRVLAEIYKKLGLQKVPKLSRNGSRMDDMRNRDRENDRTGPRSIFRPLPDLQNPNNQPKINKKTVWGLSLGLCHDGLCCFEPASGCKFLCAAYAAVFLPPRLLLRRAEVAIVDLNRSLP